MYYQGDELIKLTSAFHAINRHESEQRRMDRKAERKPVSNPVPNLLDLLRRTIKSERRAAPERVH